MSAESYFKLGNGVYHTLINKSYWNDTTTVWSSLGTVTFPYAQSGSITIKRVG